MEFALGLEVGVDHRVANGGSRCANIEREKEGVGLSDPVLDGTRCYAIRDRL